MNAEDVISLNDPRADLELVGGKGASLARLSNAGLPVPDGFYVTTAAYRKFVAANCLKTKIAAALEGVDASQPATLELASQDIREGFSRGKIPPEVANSIVQAYAELPGHNPAVAVRSSATAEDLPEASFAGQQETYLNVSGADELLEATKKCWASLWTARAIGYRARQGIPPERVDLAVVVQLLVDAEAAGILFTVDPVTGQRDQVVISAAWGLGEAVVGGAVNPDTLRVDKGSGEVIEHQTVDKELMTVRVDGGTEEQPVPENLRHVPVLDDAAAAELTWLGVQIEQLYERPMDIEWALADGEFAILQARPITVLPEPEVAPPVDWEVPNPKARYLRNNIVELMPDPLTPLFDSFGRRVINASMNRTMDAFLGKHELLPEELIVTINGYAYYNGEFTPKQIVEMLLGSVGIMRRMFTGMEDRWRVARVRYVETVERRRSESGEQLTAAELLEAAEALLDGATEYYMAIVSGLVPAAWISEGIFTFVYDRLIKRQGDPRAATYLLGFDSKPIEGEKALYDLATWARSHPGLRAYLVGTPTASLVAQLDGDEAPPGVEGELWREWQQRTRRYLETYGATIYGLDFAKPTPYDDPAPVLETFKLFLRGQGSDPHARQQAMAERREQATGAIMGRLGGVRLSLFRKALARAQKYAPLREDGLADLGLGYPLLRGRLLELGRRLTLGGAMKADEDIFWLVADEVQRAAAALDGEEPVNDHVDTICQRKAVWRAQKRVTPPIALPQRAKFLGIDPEKFLPGRGGVRDENVLRGVACSPGRVTAVARVLHGPEEFDQMRSGDILVAGITTPAWTPLFALASGIVTDVGGPLSHGSIVAREYGIPAVLGVGEATRRIKSGQEVTVDGGEGEVIIREA